MRNIIVFLCVCLSCTVLPTSWSCYYRWALHDAGLHLTILSRTIMVVEKLS